MTETLIISGATSDIGEHLARQALHSGLYSVALMARHQGRLTDLQQRLASDNPHQQLISTHSVDTTDSDATLKAFDAITQQHGSVNHLVNTVATWMGMHGIKDLDADTVRQSFELNFMTAFNACKSFLSFTQSSVATPASIINFGATAGLRGGAKFTAFASAKFALRAMTQSIARELSAEYVHAVYLIIDGVIGNEKTKKMNPSLKDDDLISVPAIANTVMTLIQQDPSCWTHELDIRPFKERF